MQTQRQPIHATGTIIAENALIAAMAVIDQWSLLSVLWVYWWQSVIIGLFAFLRMLGLRQFSTEGLSANGHPVEATPSAKRSVAGFFVLHFGGFHAAYLVFLTVSGAVASIAWPWLVISVASFVYTHGRSHLENRAADLAGRPNLGTMMFLPYARVVPMHLMLIIGLGAGVDGTAGLLGFLLLKTGADVLMHIVEHSALRRGAVSGADLGAHSQ